FDTSADDPFGGLARIMVVRLSGEYDFARGIIFAAGIELANDRMHRLRRCSVGRRSTHAVDEGIRRHLSHSVDESSRSGIARCQRHVQRAMRLDMLKTSSVNVSKLPQRANLVDNVVHHLLDTCLDLAASEPMQITEA